MYLSTRAASSVLSALLLKSLSLIPTSLRDELFLMKNKKECLWIMFANRLDTFT
jgi:hypothetical protein